MQDSWNIISIFFVLWIVYNTYCSLTSPFIIIYFITAIIIYFVINITIIITSENNYFVISIRTSNRIVLEIMKDMIPTSICCSWYFHFFHFISPSFCSYYGSFICSKSNQYCIIIIFSFTY